jgi:hypothetical protein
VIAMNDDELAATQTKIKTLGGVYALLFFGSLVVLVYQSIQKDFRGASVALWAVLLGGAIATRLYRQSLVSKYNAEIAARRGQPASIR